MKRPKLKTKTSKAEWGLEIICLLALGVMVYSLAVNVDSLPERLPLHYNISGEIDRYGSRSSIWLLPGIAFFLYALMTLFTNYPHLFNYPFGITAENAARQYQNAQWMMRVVKLVVTGQLTYFIVVLTGDRMVNSYFFSASLLVLFGTVLFFVIRGYRLR